MWQFLKVKALATRKLDTLDIEPIDKAVMALQYEVDPAFGWLERAYTAIGGREEPNSKAEAERLGLDVVVHLAELRERVRKTRFEQEKIVLQQMSIATHVPSPTTNPSGSLSQLDQHNADTTSSQNLPLTECGPKSPTPVGLPLEKALENHTLSDFRVHGDIGDPLTFSLVAPSSSKKSKVKKVKKVKKVMEEIPEPVVDSDKYNLSLEDELEAIIAADKSRYCT